MSCDRSPRDSEKEFPNLSDISYASSSISNLAVALSVICGHFSHILQQPPTLPELTLLFVTPDYGHNHEDPSQIQTGAATGKSRSVKLQTVLIFIYARDYSSPRWRSS
jgi:hypothetical protein